MLEKSFKAGDTVLDDIAIRDIVKELLASSDESTRLADEHLSAELLQLSTLLLQYMPTEFEVHIKDVIAFGWNQLKREDTTTRYCAFLNVSR